MEAWSPIPIATMKVDMWNLRQKLKRPPTKTDVNAAARRGKMQPASVYLEHLGWLRWGSEEEPRNWENVLAHCGISVPPK